MLPILTITWKTEFRRNFIPGEKITTEGYVVVLMFQCLKSLA